MTIGNEPPKYVAVVGSRDFPCPDMVRAEIDKFKALVGWTVLSGGCPGKNRETSVDTIAADYARSIGMPVKELFADWDALGRAAGLIRNTKLVEQSKALVICWDGSSRGTADTCIKAWRANRKCKMLLPNGFVTTDIVLIAALAASARKEPEVTQEILEANGSDSVQFTKLRNEVFNFLVATYQTKG